MKFSFKGLIYTLVGVGRKYIKKSIGSSGSMYLLPGNPSLNAMEAYTGTAVKADVPTPRTSTRGTPLYTVGLAACTRPCMPLCRRLTRLAASLRAELLPNAAF